MSLFKPRFGIKALFVLTAIVGMLLAYPVWWIHKRHQLLADYDAELKAYFEVRGGPASKLIGTRRTARIVKPLPWLLRLFGEPAHDYIEIVRWLTPEHFKGIHGISEADDRLQIELDALFEKERPFASSYFPEAEIQLTAYVVLDHPQSPTTLKLNRGVK